MIAKIFFIKKKPNERMNMISRSAKIFFERSPAELVKGLYFKIIPRTPHAANSLRNKPLPSPRYNLRKYFISFILCKR